MQPTNETKPRERWTHLPKLAGLLGMLVPLLTVVLHPGLRAEMVEGIRILSSGNLNALHVWAAEFGVWAPLATSALMIAQALAAPIPAVLVTWTNALLFGWFPGGCLSIVSATVAASICYGIGRIFGLPLANRFVRPETLQQWEKSIDRYGANAILLARLIPFVPFDPISYIAGIVRMRFWPFFLMTLLGQIPAGFAYSYLGEQVTQPARLVVTSICVVVALVVIGLTARRILQGREP
tara:strand:- start:17083 stop:17796 length:714 start_codon:yes stop_codon:yes gene_type:complete